MAMSITFRYHQRGVALIITLLILLVMTIVSVSSVQTTTIEERMAGNLRDRNLAFQAAETALRNAESFIEGLDPETFEALVQPAAPACWAHRPTNPAIYSTPVNGLSHSSTLAI